MGNFHHVTVRNGKSVIILASVKLPPTQAAKLTGFEFVIRTGKGASTVDPVPFFTRKTE